MSGFEQQMDGKAAPQRVWSGHQICSSRRSQREPAVAAGQRQTLGLVLLVSLGLWALIWGAVSLVGAFG